MKNYRGFGKTLYHETPAWVNTDAHFHISIRSEGTNLIDPGLALQLLNSVKFYEDRKRWQATVFLLMPDHLHAIISLGFGEILGGVVGDWKRFHTRNNGVQWQEKFFDHRLRDGERGEHVESTLHYIRQNPVVCGLCGKAEDWRWVYPRQDKQ